MIVQTHLSPNKHSVVRTPITGVGSFNLIADLFYSATKRMLDILGALIILSVALPVMVVASLLIRMSSPGPAIYCQRRLTAGDKIFTMFKFRTMNCDAEEKTGAVWADENDPRITNVGRLMRATRLDELPQLFNVLIGDMSLVGPRPERPEIARKLKQHFPSFHRRTDVPAGITGMAQIASGYAATLESYREKLAWDLLYIKKRSLVLDLQIAVRTLRVVFSGRGSR